MSATATMKFITNLNDCETNARLRRMIRHVDSDTAATIQKIRREGFEEAVGVRNAMLTKGYRKVDKWYEAKVRSLHKADIIATKIASNEARLRLLTAKSDRVKSTIGDAYERLIVLQASGNVFYVSILKALTLQAICQLLEPRVRLVLCRGDVQLIEPLLPEIVSEYARITGGLKVQITVDANVFLPDNWLGGVLARNATTVFVDNTLANRFRRSTDVQLFPFLRSRLFEGAQNRCCEDHRTAPHLNI